MDNCARSKSSLYYSRKTLFTITVFFFFNLILCHLYKRYTDITFKYIVDTIKIPLNLYTIANLDRPPKFKVPNKNVFHSVVIFFWLMANLNIFLLYNVTQSKNGDIMAPSNNNLFIPIL